MSYWCGTAGSCRTPGEYLLYVGAYGENKNVRCLMHAYVELCKVKPDTPSLVLAGKRGRNSVDPIATARLLNNGERVHYLGFVADEQLPSLYQGASLFVFPSFHEGFGVPILEAMACGTPVVTSDLAAMPEVAGDAAVLADPL